MHASSEQPTETIDDSPSKGGPTTMLKVKIAKRMKMTNIVLAALANLNLKNTL
jgi:hypothetical protein